MGRFFGRFERRRRASITRKVAWQLLPCLGRDRLKIAPNGGLKRRPRAGGRNQRDTLHGVVRECSCRDADRNRFKTNQAHPGSGSKLDIGPTDTKAPCNTTPSGRNGKFMNSNA